jgi:regulator of sigma E protease
MMFLIIPLVVIIFALLVIVHELGHFLVAKREGIRVEEFGLGFPPRVWSKKYGETVYSINLIPLGGFVRMFGEEGEGSQDPESFSAQSPLSRARVIVAGVAMHLLLAFLLLVGLFWSGSPLIIGQASDYPGVTVKYQRIVVASVENKSPAQTAGLTEGDQILSINGTKYGDDEIARTYLLSQASEKVSLQVKQGSHTSTKIVQLRPESQAQKGVLGVQLGTVQYVHIPAWEVPYVAIQEEAKIAWTIVVSLGGVIAGLFGHNSGAAISQVSGPIGITAIIAKVASFGVEPLVRLIVILTMSLAVFNILPIPALDGGRLFFVLLEAARGRKVKTTVENTVHATGFWLLIGLILLISVWDVIRISSNKLGI